MGRLDSKNKDRIWQPLFDTMVVPAAAGAAGTQFVMFINPVGAAAQTPLTTNMQQGGHMAAGEAFKCFGVTAMPMKTAVPVPLTDNLDWMNFTSVALLEINIGHKNYFRLPLQKLPAGAGAFQTSGGAGTAIQDWMTNGIPDARASYTFKPEYLWFNPLEPFNVIVTTIAAPLAAPVTAFNILITLEGMIYRNIQ